MTLRRELRRRVGRKLKVAAAVGMAHIPETSRTTLLAMAEILRRAEQRAAAPDSFQRSLTPFELRVFSQNGEDGVIQEIMHRVGTSSRSFVEFGAASFEANCILLADVFSWQGLFIDASKRQFSRLYRKYGAISGVTVLNARATPENIEALFADAGIPLEPDVLSIDIDGEDYYVWQAIERYRPRVVVIEYNSGLDLVRCLVQPRRASGWDGTAFYGASLGALESLAYRKGYRLVHTELTGNNAFFVRDDLGGQFPEHADVPRRGSNYRLRGFAHDPDPAARPFIDLDPPA